VTKTIKNASSSAKFGKSLEREGEQVLCLGLSWLKYFFSRFNLFIFFYENKQKDIYLTIYKFLQISYIENQPTR
jgi:hypothetical protein